MPDVRAQLEPVPYKIIPAALENSLTHTFKINVPVGRSLYISVAEGLKSFGGYELLKSFEAIERFPDYPRELMIMSQGAILSLGGDKKIPLLGRNIHQAEFKLYRILPGQLNQFIFANYLYSSDFARPQFNNSSLETLSEIFRKEVAVPFVNPAKTQYFSFDLEQYLDQDGGSKKGLFYLNVVSKTDGSLSDRRLVLLTDLGVIVKETVDRRHVVFVQNLRTGLPVVGADIEVMGTNGIPVVTQKTGADGSAFFPDLSNFKDEKQPIAFVAKKDGDLSFLPYQMSGRSIIYSQFDVGGVHDSFENDQLTAFLFSDRGIYRPGDTINIGSMVRARNWKKTFSNLPVSWSVTDARGVQIHKEKVNVDSSGLLALSFKTEEATATGLYSIQVHLLKDNQHE